MRSIEEILEELREELRELREHPDFAYLRVFTYSEVISSYVGWLEWYNLGSDDPDVYNFNNLDFNHTHLSDSDKKYICNQIDEFFKYYVVKTDPDYASLFGSINDLPNLKKMIMNEVKLNALLNKNKDDEN
jgi:hypothetical protein